MTDGIDGRHRRPALGAGLGQSRAPATISLDTILMPPVSRSPIPLSLCCPQHANSSSKRFGVWQRKKRLARRAGPLESQSGGEQTPC